MKTMRIPLATMLLVPFLAAAAFADDSAQATQIPSADPAATLEPAVSAIQEAEATREPAALKAKAQPPSKAGKGKSNQAQLRKPAQSSPFLHCPAPSLMALAREILEYEAQGYALPGSKKSCRNRRAFRFFAIGDEDGGEADEPNNGAEIIYADDGPGAFEVINVKPIPNPRAPNSRPEQFEIEFVINSKNSQGAKVQTRATTQFTLVDGPQSRDPSVGCVLYEGNPSRLFMRRSCGR